MRKSAAEKRFHDLALQRVGLILQADEGVEQILEGGKLGGREERKEMEGGKKGKSWREGREERVGEREESWRAGREVGRRKKKMN